MTDRIDETFSPPLPEHVDEAIARAREGLLALPSADGAWHTVDACGPAITGWGLVALHYLGALKVRDASGSVTFNGRPVSGAVAFIRGQQLESGAFPDYPTDTRGSLEATCACYAGLYAAGVDPRSHVMACAWDYIVEQGGLDAVDAMSQVFSQVFLVAAGLRSPTWLPDVFLAWMLIPGARRAIGRSVSSPFSLLLNALLGLMRGLKARRVEPLPARDLLRWMENQNLIAYLKRVQDPTGHWFGSLLHTALCAMALHALGLSESDPAIARAVAYFARWQSPPEPDGSWQFVAYGSETWNTALWVRSLITSGVPADDPRIRRAVVFLLSCQGRLDQPPELQNTAPLAPRHGGWPFEEANAFGLDCDSTGQVLAALAAVRDAPSVTGAINEGLAWIAGMQNCDGGWAAFSWGHVGKVGGPYALGILLPRDTILAFLVTAPFLPLLIGDPSSADLTARVLLGLSALGYRVGHPMVDRAVAFLRDQVYDNHVWWGRWECNYLPSTAYVLQALAGVGADLEACSVPRAVHWIERHQNYDGGFGESLDSYSNQGFAGIGRSDAYTTGLVVSALLAVGVRGEVIDKAVCYLLTKYQEESSKEGSSGLLKGRCVRGVVGPPMPFYDMPAGPPTAALQALVDYRRLVLAGRVQGVKPQ